MTIKQKIKEKKSLEKIYEKSTILRYERISKEKQQEVENKRKKKKLNKIRQVGVYF